MDVYCIQYVLSNRYDAVGTIGPLHTCLETSTTLLNHSILSINFLLLVSSFFLFGFSSCFNCILWFSTSFLTESPRWLISKGREEKAYQILFNKKYDMEFTEKEKAKLREAEQEMVSWLNFRKVNYNLIWSFLLAAKNYRWWKIEKRFGVQRSQSFIWATATSSNGTNLPFHLVRYCTFILRNRYVNRYTSLVRSNKLLAISFLSFDKLNNAVNSISLSTPSNVPLTLNPYIITWAVLAVFLALNADNLAANRVVYVASTGAVDFVSYILSIILLNFFGRKLSSCGLFALSGFFLLSLLMVPRGNSIHFLVVACVLFCHFFNWWPYIQLQWNDK